MNPKSGSPLERNAAATSSSQQQDRSARLEFGAFKSQSWRGLILFLVVGSIITLLILFQIGRSSENLILDFFYRLGIESSQPQDLLIVTIDESSFQELGLPWPWPRRLHAALIDRLASMGARLIVFDILFAEATNPEDDELLTEAMRRSGNVILGATIELTKDPRFSRQILIEPQASFRSAAHGLGLIMLTPDSDGVVRHFRTSLAGRDTLPAAVVRSLSPPVNVPMDLHGLIHYPGPPRSIDTLSYYQILDTAHPIPAEKVRDRIVLVGMMLAATATPQSQADSFHTPFYADTGQLMAGVELHGNIIHTLMTGNWGQEVPVPWQLGISLLLILTGAMVMSRLRLSIALAALACLVALTFCISLLLFKRWFLWLPPLLTAFGLISTYVGSITWNYLLEYREKRWLRAAFGRYVSASLVETITAHPERLELGGEEMEVTVLFSDLVGFTQLAEGMSPKGLISLLNEYFAVMTDIILAQMGTLDKFIGDALMAVWGAPVPMADHAVRACRSALEMRKAMAQLRANWEQEGMPRLSARVGLHSGRVLAGNVGSKERFNYTVMGDTVNLASRLEGVNKQYGTEILMSEATHDLLGDQFLTREIDSVQVKGRRQPVTIFELVDYPSPSGERSWLSAFEAGRKFYQICDWSQAEKYFQEVLQHKPDDQPAKVFLERCLHYRQDPPPAEWQGVFVLKEK